MVRWTVSSGERRELGRAAEASGAKPRPNTKAITLSAKVDVNQFYGIDLEEFPARIAEIALWMMDHIMNMRLSDALGGYYPRIPLKAAPTIRPTDALELNWSEVLPPGQCSYVFGNPPFAGSKYQSAAQRAQIIRIADLKGKQGTLDYVAVWFLKAGAYIQESSAQIGFVATNSITQGEQVAELWPVLFNRYQLSISFAHRTFAWGSEARGKAHVHVVIIGLTKKRYAPKIKRLFDYPDLNGSPSETLVGAISPYLFDASLLNDPETVVREEPKSPTGLPRMVSGSQPLDFEQYVLSDERREKLVAIEPKAAKFVRPYIGSDGFINGEKTWILALQHATPSEIREMPEMRRRMQIVSAKRSESPRPQTNKIARTPTIFNVTVAPAGEFLVVPKVSSARREYVPIAYLRAPTIPSDLVFVVENATPWLFGVLTSRMHMAWLGYIGGRLKSDFRYSIGLVYNPFPWPQLSPQDELELGALASAILVARSNHSEDTLAALYDPDTMPPDLRKAHARLDTRIDRLYRREVFVSDRERVEHLLARYEEGRAPLIPQPKGAKRHRSKRAAA